MGGGVRLVHVRVERARSGLLLERVEYRAPIDASDERRAMTYTCPVCEYDKLVDPPEDHEICPSCGTHFGLDDDQRSHADLRAAWIAAGRPWFSRSTPPPRMDTTKVTRVEVIDPTGRAYTYWKDGSRVEAQLQDDGRTLKVFIAAPPFKACDLCVTPDYCARERCYIAPKSKPSE